MKKILLGIMVFFLSFSFASADVKVGNNFKKEYEDYLNKLPAPITFVGNEGFQGVPGFHLSPVSLVNMEVKGEKSYTSGDAMVLDGIVTFAFQGDDMASEVAKICAEATDGEKECKSSPFYKLPSLNNVNVFVQVWREDEESKNGDYLISEFYVLENANIKDGETETFEVNYRIPKGAVEGSYYLALFVNTNKRFDILGLPLAVFNEGAKFNFQVESDGKGVYLDKDNIKLNDESYAYRKPAPSIEGNTNIALPLVNNTDAEQKVSITYDLYQWGQTDKSDIIDTKTEEKVVPANSTTDLTYAFSPNDTSSVYNLKVTADTQDTKSTSNIRFVMRGKDRGIFRYLGLLQDSQDSSEAFPYFCVRNAQWEGIFKGKVKISIYDEQDKEIGSHEEAARIKAKDECFSARNGKTNIKSDYVKIKGEIFDENGNLVDKAEISYDLAKKTVLSEAEEITSSKTTILLVTVIVILLSGGILILTINKKKNVK